MKKLFLPLLLAAVVLAFQVVPAQAGNGWGLEDPQLCVNGQLLSVASYSHLDVHVSVPAGSQVDFNVANCGGTFASVPVGNVTFDGKNKMVVTASTDRKASVTFSFGDSSVVRSGGSGLVKAKFDLE